MSVLKKVLSVLLCLCMVFSFMNLAFAEAGNEITLSVMIPDFYSYSDWMTLEEGNPVLQAIYEATGVKLNITWVPNTNYTERTMLAIASYDMPDIMVLQDPRSSLIISAARSGAFWDLTDLYKKYPNLAQGQASIYGNTAIDGRIYGIYRARAYARAGIYYRNDYAAKAGITKAPTNVAEFKELCFALAGLENMYAINMCKYVAGTIGIVTVMFGAPCQYGRDAQGNLYPAWEDEKFQEGLDFLRELYAAGGIDPNFMNIETSQWDAAERCNPPKALMRLDVLDGGYRYEEWLENNLGVDPGNPVVTMLTALPNSDGKIQIWPQNTGASGQVAVTKSVSEAELPAVLSFLDWCNSSEGQNILQNGLEGVNYWFHADGSRRTYPEGEEENASQYTEYNNKVLHSLSQLAMNVSGGQAASTSQSALREWYNQNLIDNAQYVISNPALTLDSETYNAVGPALSQEVEDAQIAYIAGRIDLAGLKAVYENWHTGGGNQILEEYQEDYASDILPYLKVNMPLALTVIQDEAFMGDTMLGSVVIQEGCTSIGARAFAGAKGLSISLPASLTAIDDTSFENAAFNVIYVVSGSYADQWCQQKGLTTKKQ